MAPVRGIRADRGAAGATPQRTGTGSLILQRNPFGEARDGEADFVVVERDRSILVVEVKGGQIASDGSTGEWTSRDAAGTIHAISDRLRRV